MLQKRSQTLLSLPATALELLPVVLKVLFRETAAETSLKSSKTEQH